MPRTLQPCGTHAAYQRHKRHGEPIDDACREAARTQSAKQAGRNPRIRRHFGPTGCGTRNGYRKHLAANEPACDPCRWANTEADRQLRATGSTIPHTPA